MTETAPSIVVLAGPNGAGKSTLAPVLLREKLTVLDYINADTIAQGLSAFAPERQAFSAGRIMLRRLHGLAEQRQSFAFESTLEAPNPIPTKAMMRTIGLSVGRGRPPMDVEPPGLEAAARAVLTGTIVGAELGLD